MCVFFLVDVYINGESGAPECPSASRLPPWHKDERWNEDCDWCNYGAADWRRGQIITALIGLCLDSEHATLWLKCRREAGVCMCEPVCVLGQPIGIVEKEREERRWKSTFCDSDLPTGVPLTRAESIHSLLRRIKNNQNMFEAFITPNRLLFPKFYGEERVISLKVLQTFKSAYVQKTKSRNKKT